MNLNIAKSLIISGFFLTKGYVADMDIEKMYSDEVTIKLKTMVAEYLTENGLRFDWTTEKNDRLIRKIVRTGRRHSEGDITYERAFWRLSFSGKIKLGNLVSIYELK